MRAHALPRAARSDGARSVSPPMACWSSRWRNAVADAVVVAAIGISVAAAPVLSVADAVARPRRTRRVAGVLRGAGMDPVRELRRIWFARTARETLRILADAGLGKAMTGRIAVLGNVDALDRPAVLAVYHTPWARLLALWMCTDRRVVLLADTLWGRRAPGVHVTSGSRGMRQLLRELRAGRCVAVTVDHFGEGGRITHPARVLGCQADACVGAARLAARAGVPIVPVALRWRRGRLEIFLGHLLTVTPESVGAGMGAVLSEFNAALRCDLSSWANAHRFLSRSAAASERRR